MSSERWLWWGKRRGLFGRGTWTFTSPYGHGRWNCKGREDTRPGVPQKRCPLNLNFTKNAASIQRLHNSLQKSGSRSMALVDNQTTAWVEFEVHCMCFWLVLARVLFLRAISNNARTFSCEVCPKQTVPIPVFKPLHLCSVSTQGRVSNDCLSHPACLFLFQAFISLIV